MMIKTWRHKGLKYFFETGVTRGIQAKHRSNLSLILLQLASAVKAEDMNTPGNHFHKLAGKYQSFYSVKVNANWRIIFKFEEGHAFDCDYLDYY